MGCRRVYDVMFDKLDLIGCLHFSKGNCFHPFREVIGYSQDKLMSFGCWRGDTSDVIYSPTSQMAMKKTLGEDVLVLDG